MHEFNIKNGFITSGQSYVYQNLTVSGLTLSAVPANDDTLTQILARDSSGNVKYRTASSLAGGSGTFTGGTVTGPTNFTAGLTANTISATTYYNLPTDIRVTGGTYSAGTATFTNNTGGTFTVTGFSTSTSATGAYLPLSGGTVTGATIFTSGVTANTISATTISKVNYIDFNTGTTNPSQTGGRVFFDNTSKALSYYDIANNLVPIAMGQQLYTRVYNVTGAQIDKGKVIAITGTTNGLPSAILAVNTHTITSARPIGLAAENIPNNSEGLVLNNGILSGITLNTFTNGDTLYQSDTVPGGYVSSTSSLAFTARTNEIGYVVQTGSTTGKIYVAINNEDSNLSLTDIERNILEGNVISTGTYEYTGMTTASTTTFNIAPMRGWVVRNTYGFATFPDVSNIYYTGGTNISVTNIASADSTYILITTGLTVTQQVTFPTPQQRRENIFLGKVNHPNRTSILNINNTVDYDVSPISSLRDLWSPIRLINQGIIPSPNGANLSFNTSSGTLWGNGINWVNSQLSPNNVSIAAKVPASFFYRTQTGGTSSSVTVIDPRNYDVGGVITSIGAAGSDDATNQRIYMYPTGVINVLYGQTKYANLAAAVAAIQSETFIPYPNAESTGILIGVLSVRNDIGTDGEFLTNTNYAKFTLVSKFGESFGGTGGLSTTTLQQAYDNSTTPEIVINAVLDGLSIKNGTGNPDNVTNLLEGINASGTTTSFIRANGAFSGNGVTASTIYATTYLNLPPATFTGGTVVGPTIFTGGLSANTISATTYQGNLVTSIVAGNNISVNQATGNVTVTAVPTGAAGEIQFSDGTNFASDTNLHYDNSSINFVAASPSYTFNAIRSGIVGGAGHSIADNSVSSFIGGGNSNTIKDSDNSVIIGGDTNTINPNANNTVILGGNSVTATASNSVYIPTLYLTTALNNDDTLTEVLVKNGTGEIKYRSASSLGGGGGTFTGGTVTGATRFTGGLTANTISATTITAGTFWDGSVNLTEAIYHVQSSGVEVFTGLTRTSSTTFSVAPVEGFVAVNAGTNDIITVSYSGTTGTTTPYLTTAISTYVLVSSASTLVLQSTFPTPQERRENIFLGRIAHPDKTTIVTANNTTDFIFSPMSALRDMFTPIPLINENISVTYSASSLGIQTTGGNLWGLGINFPTNPIDPDRVVYAGAAPATFQYRTQTGGTYGNTTSLDVGYWDNAGVRTAVSGTVATNQRVYLYPSGQIRIQYGQKQYADLASAVSGLFTESFVTLENNRLNSILISVISVVSNATDLSNTSQAFFSSVSKFGEVLGGTGGLATTTLQQAYANSSDPAITTNSSNGALEIRGGTGNDNDLNFVIQNNAGVNRGAWDANGDLTATTVSATTYYNLPVSGLTQGSNITITNNGQGNYTISSTGGGSGSFTGGTVNGPTTFTSGVTANTIVYSIITLTYAATISVNAVLGNEFKVTLTGNAVLGNPSGAVDGQYLRFAIRQDGTGNRNLTFDTKYRFGNEIGTPSVDLTANKTSYLGVRYNVADDRFDVISFVSGY
jgi:hypothetical protein